MFQKIDEFNKPIHLYTRCVFQIKYFQYWQNLKIVKKKR